MLWNIVQKKKTGLVGEMRLRAQHSIPKLNTVVNKTTTTTFMKSVMLFFLHILRWLSGKESACNAGDASLILGSGRSPEEGNGNPLQYSCLGNTMDNGAWWATVHGVAKRQA